MLGLADEFEISESTWDDLPSRAELPCAPEDFFDPGAAALFGDSRRQYHRFFLRERAFLVRRDALFAVYTKDASRKGIGLISPIQLFPRDLVKLLLPEFGTMTLSVRRCRRISSMCYDCGTVFADGLASPAAYKELIDRQRQRQLKRTASATSGD
jgi:PilZ domain